ncbi:hypothetical protein D9756_000079 [Leucocoprinus leucothites]|uniref:RlpA-like protein double-psi beta-barrel domain-containing protein n=1 Tax=Leucocoprinus leucothites TaxID=201217 RepID=A0A8H5LMS2_9AGAR|nr:hypothetical protein D9756_000079 [Leucoagaricus leucothites]
MFKFRLLALTGFAAFLQGVLATTGRATFYEPGFGSCGVSNNSSDFVVALNPADYADCASCGRQVHVTFQGKSVDVTVANLCPACGTGAIDLSPSAFKQLADISAGILDVEWDFTS